jgi:hypothetical protein
MVPDPQMVRVQRDRPHGVAPRDMTIPCAPWILLIALLAGWQAAPAAEGYEELAFSGWTVLTDRGHREGPEAERASFATALTDQVTKLGRLPPAAQALIRPVRIFVSSGTHRAFGAQHHPSRDWLAQNGYPPDFAGNVEICNWREFTTLVKGQPFCLLHEMSHAYHHLRPDLDAAIRAAYEHAKAAGLYQKVTRSHGKEPVQAYAITNHHEYFAELSEAYFGENDFFPYDRNDLRTYDPDGYAMIETAWAVH